MSKSTIQIEIDKGGVAEGLMSEFESYLSGAEPHYYGQDTTELVNDKRIQLQRLTERILELPDVLQFGNEPLLIFGENGAGKSTIANAIGISALYAARVSQLKQEGIVDAEQYAYEKFYEEPFAHPVRGGTPMVVEGKLWQTDSYAYLYESDGLAPFVAKHFRAMLPDESTSFGLIRINLANETPKRIHCHTGLEEFRKERALDILSGASNREHLDQTLKSRKPFGSRSRDTKAEDGKVLCVVLDEPERGLSPWRHLDLLQDIVQRKYVNYSSDYTIIPTNSPVLLQQSKDLKRINLEEPNLGVH